MRVQLLNGASLDTDAVSLIGGLLRAGNVASYTIRFLCGDKYERSSLGLDASSVEEIEREHSLLTGLFIDEITLEDYVRAVSKL